MLIGSIFISLDNTFSIEKHWLRLGSVAAQLVKWFVNRIQIYCGYPPCRWLISWITNHVANLVDHPSTGSWLKSSALHKENMLLRKRSVSLVWIVYWKGNELFRYTVYGSWIRSTGLLDGTWIKEVSESRLDCDWMPLNVSFHQNDKVASSHVIWCCVFNL